MKSYALALMWLCRDGLIEHENIEVLDSNFLADGAEMNIEFQGGYYNIKISPITADCAYCGQMTFQHPEAEKEKLQVLCPACKMKQDETRGILD